MNTAGSLTPSQHRRLAQHYHRRWLTLAKLVATMPSHRLPDYRAMQAKMHAHERAADTGL